MFDQEVINEIDNEIKLIREDMKELAGQIQNVSRDVSENRRTPNMQHHQSTASRKTAV